MDLKDYQHEAMKFANYKSKKYPYFLLNTEIWEYIDKFNKKEHRGDDIPDYDLLQLKELGDILWACAAIGTQNMFNIKLKTKAEITFEEISFAALQILNFKDENFKPKKLKILINLISVVVAFVQQEAIKLNSSLYEVCKINILKLTDRKNRNKIKGSGDLR